MAQISDSAYPKFKKNPSLKELESIYTPSNEEKKFAWERTTDYKQQFRLLLWLKIFQRLGYFPKVIEIPASILTHIAESVSLDEFPEFLYENDNSIEWHHKSLVREYLGVTKFGKPARDLVMQSCLKASTTREDLIDIVNVAIEELIRHRFELPAFDTLMRIARKARTQINDNYYTLVFSRLSRQSRSNLLSLFDIVGKANKSTWNSIKQEPRKPTVKNTKEFIDHLMWLLKYDLRREAFGEIPDVKIKQFAAESRSLDVASMRQFAQPKRTTLAASLLLMQVGRAYDDVSDMYIRLVNRMHNRAYEALKEYRHEQAKETDYLVETLRDISVAFKAEQTSDTRMKAISNIIEPQVDSLIERCNKHVIYSGNNYLPLLPSYYKNQRSVLFSFIEKVDLISTSQDKSTIEAIQFILTNRATRAEWIDIDGTLDLSFVSEKWLHLIAGQRNANKNVKRIHKRNMELCVFTQVMNELKSGDLCIPLSDKYRDYREQLISWQEYERVVTTYGDQAGISVNPQEFVYKLKNELETQAKTTDSEFPRNEYLSLDGNEPILKRLTGSPKPKGLASFEELLKRYMKESDILNIIWETEQWLNWSKHFGPISGLEAKIKDPGVKYAITAFCYGCNLGPTQTARSVSQIKRRQISNINQRHITEQKLNEAIVTAVNAYEEIPLQKVWGLGKSASADGTKWDLYPQNIMSEYHIRYGGYGGIGYYLIADSYIALFSRFTTCGSWEGHYILDFVNENESNVQPDTIHADTQGQSAPIFGLSYLLGIKLMPRIRNWKDLKFYKTSNENTYHHIDSIFSGQIDWKLIESMFPDMLRVALSIKAGTIAPSTILRRLGTYSRKNKLYYAFKELGLAVRTMFLLNYLADLEVRKMISVATNKSERFNQFAQFLMFGSKGVISENTRDEQRKIIKYNHLVANLIMMHTVVTMSNAIDNMQADGHSVDSETLSCLSPYQTEHINRFGEYDLDSTQEPVSLEPAMNITILENVMSRL